MFMYGLGRKTLVSFHSERVAMTTVKANRRPAMVLLVVLGMLTFFSILVASYLVFSNQSRQSSFVIASRNTRAPDVKGIIDQALMKLIVGTDDVNDPFYGEDLLSDYYGRYDAISLQVRPTGAFTCNLGNGFATFPISLAPITSGSGTPPTTDDWNDIFTGRVVTFLQGPLEDRSFRVMRSIQAGVTAPMQTLVIELPAELVASGIISATPSEVEIRNLFYPNGLNNVGYTLHMNGSPRNSAGIGTTGPPPQRNATTHAAPAAGLGLPNLPRSLQPNHLGRLTVKMNDTNGVPANDQGDFDESYDAADFYNWYMSYRETTIDTAGNRVIKVTPSFHRPAVINYVLNHGGFSSGFADPVMRRNGLVSIARATFRPLPLASTMLSSGSSLNETFTGSNSNYVLRAPIDLIAVADENAARFRLDQLAKALIGSTVDWNPWDVDNDKDGIPDSIWMDLHLPVIMSKEGKLLKPLVAAQIEDLSARLNVNAHGNLELDHTENSGGIVGRTTWADSRSQVDSTANDKRVFRGIGYGPAEITIPAPTTANATVLANLESIRTERYQPGGRANIANPAPGRQGQDDLDVILNGYRPPRHAIDSGFGYSIDPFGRAGVGLGRGGHIMFPNAGENATPVGSNEALNDPYEYDPTGKLSGDRAFSFADLEPLLQSNSFDVELLPQNLYGRLQALMETFPDYDNAFTTASVSDDSLAVPIGRNETVPNVPALRRIVNLVFNNPATLTNNRVTELIAPELRLGRKIDLNRRFGNGIDDPHPVTGLNGVIDEPGELALENNRAFQPNIASGLTLPTGFNRTPDYTYGSGGNARELFARHLYVLMMALTRDATFPSIDPAIPIDPDPVQMNLYRARRIAQWAVNVVDYRDPDSIMTRFAFDPNPFDGWAATDPANVVWGVEQPELVFSESLAFHDVRVRDTTRDGTGNSKTSTPPDPNTDQVRLPQGSLFLELYCPRVSLDSSSLANAQLDQRGKQAAPRELYAETTVGDPRTMALQLNATAANDPAGVPVWRLAISEPHTSYIDVASAGADSPLVMREANPSTTTFEPSSMDDLVPGTSLTLDRYVWFRTYQDEMALDAVTSLVTGMDTSNTFFAPDLPINAQLSLLPGQFLTLAPRTETRMGSSFFSGDAPDRPSRERFEAVIDEGVVYYNRMTATGARLTPNFGFASTNPFAPAKPIVIGAFPPTTGNWTPALIDGYVGLNVSEPIPSDGGYYPLPTESYDNGTNYPLLDAYVDLTDTATSSRDQPVDFGRSRIPFNPPNDPSGEPVLGGIPDYCTVFLQRLADPTLPFNDITNPYRTMDWMTVDLNVFSGEELEDRVTGAAADYLTRSRQRNGHGGGTPGTLARNVLFSYETFDPELGRLDTSVLPGEPFFKFPLTAGSGSHIRNSLSFLNTRFPISVPGIGAINNSFDGFSASIGMTRNLGTVPDGAPNVTNFDRNLPQVPYAQHPWLNRPFATPLELMMVPACSQSRLFEEFTIPREGFDPIVYSENSPSLNSPASIQRFIGPFRHLLNFFHGDSRGTSPTDPPDPNRQMKLADFSQIFDFVHTLPRYRGELEVISPNRLTPTQISTMYPVPFNFKYDNRRQGRVNLNTLAEFPVWAGLMQGHLTPDEVQTRSSPDQLSFNNFVANRRGYSLPGNGVTNFNAGSTPNYDPDRFDPDLPTEFAAVYRSHREAEFGLTLRTPATRTLRRRPSDTAYLRRLDFLGTQNPPGQNSLFVRRIGETPVEPTSPVPPADATSATLNVGDFSMSRMRNPYTRYQTAMRMPNLASDNSQTYVIRMTVGLFEVDPQNQSLGREYNEELGLNERYEAMFIIDRSRPVGFIPGEPLNARDVVVFEKYYQ